MRQHLQRSSLKLFAAFFLIITGLLAQDIANYLTPGVARVGSQLSCRCGGCKETIGNCPMVRCDFADPMRRRIFNMQGRGMSDSAIVKTIVKEQGVIALAGQQPLAWIAWLMPPIALLLGFWVYTSWIRRNRAIPAALTDADHAMMERFRTQIDRETGDDFRGHA